ncbi:MAG TPA: hypothetical protein VIM99_09565 [Blastocatellia bacterium]
MAVLCLAAFIVLKFVPDQTIFGWVIRLYSADGVISPEGRHLIEALLSRARMASVAGAGLGFGVGVMLWRAENAMERINQTRLNSLPRVEERNRANVILWASVAAFCAARLAIGSVHLGDSLWHDELATIKHFGTASLGTIFGFNGKNSMNNHVLNSLLLRLSVAFGWTSEEGMRIWNFLASTLTIPAAYYLGRVIGLGRVSLFVLLSLVATSPVVDYFGEQARGYGLAIFLATLSLSLHLDCFKRPSASKFIALHAVNVSLILANLFTFPLVCGQIAHLLIEGLHSNSGSRLHGYPGYRAHIFSLVSSAVFAIALHAFLLPTYLYDSIFHASKEPVTVSTVLRMLSATLNPYGSVAIGGALAIALIWYAIARVHVESGKRIRLALLAIILSGIGAGILAKAHELCAFAYLHVPIAATLAICADRLSRRSHLTSSITLASAAAFCLWGAYAAVNRLPIQDYRGTIRAAERLARGRLIWTSGLEGESLNHYAQAPVLKSLPRQPSLYLSLFDDLANDEARNAVKKNCQAVERVPSQVSIVIYECQ